MRPAILCGARVRYPNAWMKTGCTYIHTCDCCMVTVADLILSSARHASFKCAYSYAIETFHDKEIWIQQEVR